MKVKLVRDSRIKHYAGEIVEVSTVEYHYLLSVGSAVEVKEPEQETAEKPKTIKKRTTAK